MPLAEGTRRVLITTVVVVGTFMQMLDQTICNVALPHMQGSLNASQEQISWVVTSYVVASAISLLLTNLLAERYGRRRMLMLAIAGFTISSLLCSTAQSIDEIVLFRILQGFSSAWVMPLSQAVLLDVYPREKQAQAISLWGMGVTFAPIIGPTIGGFLTEQFNWRWVFLINLPIGIVTLIGMFLLIRETEREPEHHFDIVGFAFIALALASLQLMLDRGQSQDWFNATEIVAEAIVTVTAFYLFVVHILTTPQPFITRALYRDWNYVLSLLLLLLFGGLPVVIIVLMPLMLQTVMGYPVLDTGLLMAPRGIGMLIALWVAVRAMRLLGARWVMIIGLAGSALTAWMVSGLTTETPKIVLIGIGFLQGIAMGILFLPVNVVMFENLDKRFVTEAASTSLLVRNIGGSVGISIMIALIANTSQTVRSDLTSHINVFSQPLRELVNSGAANPAALALINREIDLQAAMTAYVDSFHLIMIGSLVLMPFVLMLRGGKRAPTSEETAAAGAA